MGHDSLPPILEIMAGRGQRSIATKVIEVNEFKFGVRCDLRGHFIGQQGLRIHHICS